MFKQAEYEGESIILKKMVKFTISQDTLDIIQKIGPSKFIRLARTGKVYDYFIKGYVNWFKTCPDTVREFLYEVFGRDESEMDDDTWIDIVCRIILLTDLADFLEEETLWIEEAPENLRYILGKALGDPDVVEENPLVTDAIINYLAEGFKVAIWANLV